MERYSGFLRGLIAVAGGLVAVSAFALINPSFTPIHLVKDSTLILWLELEEDTKGVFPAVVRKALKGKTDKQTLRLDASSADEATLTALREMVAAAEPAMLFKGQFTDEPGGPATQREYISIGGKWALCDAAPEGLVLGKLGDSGMSAVWAGGTDMLRRVVDYVLTDDDPVVPVSEGISWREPPAKLASLGETVRAVRAVDVFGNGKPVLFVASDAGDRLLEVAKAPAVTDLTAARGLQSKSRAFAWGNFAGRGRLDLVSFDGKSLTMQWQQADGKFLARPLDLGPAVAAGCSDIAATDVGNGRAGLVVSGASLPVVVAWDGSGNATAASLVAPGVDLAKLGNPGACLVADFDNDGCADVLLPAEAGSVFFHGNAPGAFAPGVACGLKLGRAPAKACLGDFDGDGRLDVFCTNATGCLLWDNRGVGEFREAFAYTGELSYGAGQRGSDCMTGDFNNDGYQDIVIAYAAKQPLLFFNRGFRTFGNAMLTNMGWSTMLPESQNGQVSACLADLDGDGAQDLTLALKNGEIWTLFRESSGQDGNALMAVASLPIGGPVQGPVTVSGWVGNRGLGAWNVVPGSGQAHFGRTDAGPVTVKWRLPGGKDRSHEVVLEQNGVSRVELE